MGKLGLILVFVSLGRNNNKVLNISNGLFYDLENSWRVSHPFLLLMNLCLGCNKCSDPS